MVMWPLSTTSVDSTSGPHEASSFLPSPGRFSTAPLIQVGKDLIALIATFSWEFAWILVSNLETRVL